jgi:hypothetical protein
LRDFNSQAFLTMDSDLLQKSTNEVREMNEKQYWIVAHSTEKGDFKNAKFPARSEKTEEVSLSFEEKYPGYLVVHIGLGELPPKTYRSLEYLN